MLEKWKKLSKKQRAVLLEILSIIVLALVLIIGCVVFLVGQGESSARPEPGMSSQQPSQSEVSSTTEDFSQTELPTDSVGPDETGEPSKTEESSKIEKPKETEKPTESEEPTEEPGPSVINKNETSEVTIGIDVSKYQGTIDWKKVADSGVDFAIIRVGYRTLTDGTITEDNNARYNLQEATKNGIKVGVYFFSTAITKQEAIEEAEWVANLISKYAITYPVAYNCERFDEPENRQYGLTKKQRTDFALAFMEKIEEEGYYAMFYAGVQELENGAAWEINRIENKYKIWVAQYMNSAYTDQSTSSYTGKHHMWQYSNNGKVSGISGSVDLNVAYFGYKDVIEPQDPTGAGNAVPDTDVLMNFKEVKEAVTAKESTNLRNIPSQGEDSKVMYTLQNGEVATRTGISDTGWSRLEFNGKIYYALSSLLTTDLESQPSQEPDDGIKTQFEDVEDWVTAKNEVNLRSIPSVTSEESQIVAKLVNGEIIKRTGINVELGWSRVEYNGQILYCVSSYLEVVEE